MGAFHIKNQTNRNGLQCRMLSPNDMRNIPMADCGSLMAHDL